MKPAKPTTVGILSLGCPRNLVDSESIAGRLASKGYKISEDMAGADIAIINTCAFTEEAKRESIDAILGLAELKKEGRLKKIIVYGCLAQRYKDELRKELPEIDAFLGKLSLNHEPRRFAITPHHYAYLKICEGCFNNCSFCIIPKIKGAFASLDAESVIKRTEALSRQGVREINVIGQDISAYGMDLCGKPQLARILKEIIRHAKGVGWIRLLYLYPGRFDDGLLKLIRDSAVVCKYIDLPIQHINPRLLRLMNRKATKKQIISFIEKARKIIPGVSFRTSIIAGFPSESEKEFRELLDFLRETKFERLGAFSYSREEGTPAFGFKGQLPERVKLRRLDAVMTLQQEVSRQVNRRFLGKEIEVLIDDDEGGSYIGRSQYDAPEVDGVVFVKSAKKLAPGEFVKVKITGTMEYDLTGEAVV